MLYNPADPFKSGKALDRADEHLKAIAADIHSGKASVKTNPITAQNLYKDIPSLDKAFFASDACTQCGLCRGICPVDNIQIQDGKPQWKHACEHCMACISWCPAGAIQYGERTEQRRRYRNPRIRVEEMLAQKGE